MTTPTTEAGRALPWNEQDELEVAWIIWFGRKCKGKIDDLAHAALEQNPFIRFSEREAEARAAADAEIARLRAVLTEWLPHRADGFTELYDWHPDDFDDSVETTRPPDHYECLECFNGPEMGHKPDCRMAHTIAALEEQP